jgi:hypothetical protein
VTAVAAAHAYKRRRWPWLVAAAILALPALLISPLLICGPTPRRQDASPDGAHSLCFVTVPMLFAMPGQGGDASGYAVLRGRDGWIEGIVSIDMVSAIDMPASWLPDEIAVPLALQLALPSPDRVLPLRILVDWSWRLRAAFGLIPHDTDFR